MKPGRHRVLTSLAAVLALGLLAACAKSAAETSGQGGPATGVRIERTYTLLYASPFQTTAGAATANALYDDIKALSPDSGQTVCPGDAGVHYTITIMQGSKELQKVTAIYGGCRVVLIGGKSYSGSGSAGQAFWNDLFHAVGPAGGPNAGASNSPPAA